MTAYKFLVLLKPEANARGVDRAGLLEMVHDHLKRHGVQVQGQSRFSGSQLRSLRALDGIYPRLSVIAQAGERALTASERAMLDRQVPDVPRYAADQARAALGCSGAELCAEGDRGRVIKLGPGAYAAHMVARGYVVLNHFFPEFRDRFHSPDAAVDAFECQASSTGLHALRDALVGHFQPECALPGSLRASARARAAELGLGEVTVARNFFHISPGYLEATQQLALLFPERGTLSDRLASYDAGGQIKRLADDLDPVRLSTLFAETEAMPLNEALQAVGRWRDIHGA